MKTGARNTTLPEADTVSRLLAAGPPPRPHSVSHHFGLLLRTSPHQVLSRYVLDRRLGTGGMGVVLAARDPELGRDVAIKIVADGRGVDAQARLAREARSVAALPHPNVVEIFDIGTFDVPASSGGADESGVFIVMELLAGPSLRDWTMHPRPLSRVLDVFADVASALAHVHLAGVVHRDVKPSNLMLTANGVVRVLDFGLAQDVGTLRSNMGGGGEAAHSATDSESGQRRAGTLVYMAPEQHRNGRVDHRADQFSFCASLIHVATGRLPFRGSSEPELLAAKLRGSGPTSTMQGLPRPLRRVLQRGLAPLPARRYRDMRALLEALQRARRGVTPRWAAVALGLGGLSVGAASVSESVSRDDVCVRLEPLGPSWSAQRESLRTHTPSSTKVELLTRRLDAHIDAWDRQRERACARTNNASAIDGHCLARRRGELDAIMRQLDRDSGGTANQILVVLSGPPHLQACAVDSVHRVELTQRLDAAASRLELSVRLGELHALRMMGRPHAAVEAAQALELDATARQIAPAVALERGMAEIALRRDDAAAESLSRGYFTAVEDQDDGLAALLAAELVRATASDQIDEPLGWARHARSHVATSAYSVGPAEAALEHNLGLLFRGRGSLDKATEHLERALAAKRRWIGPESLPTAAAMTDAGTVYMERGRTEQAKQLLTESLAIKQRLLGAEHPLLATTLDALGAIANVQGSPGLGKAYHQWALEVRVAALGAEHPAVADTLINRAHSLRALGLPAQAELDVRRALEIYSRRPHIIDREIGVSRAVLGEVLLDRGQTDQAISQLEQAAAALERAGPGSGSLLPLVDASLAAARRGVSPSAASL